MTYIITGYFGSGKTEFCVNLALSLTAGDRGRSPLQGGVTIADLDVINPYFRSREVAGKLAAHGITLTGDNLDLNTGQDLPAINLGFLSKIRAGERVIIDLGGGTSGARLLAACRDAILDAKAYEFLCVINPFRPDMDTVDKIVEFVKSINLSTNMAITGLVNNGNMLHHTTAEDVLQAQDLVAQAAAQLNLPVAYTLLQKNIYEQVHTKIISNKILTFDKLQMRENWQ